MTEAQSRFLASAIRRKSLFLRLSILEEEPDLSFAEFGDPGRPYTAPEVEDAGGEAQPPGTVGGPSGTRTLDPRSSGPDGARVVESPTEPPQPGEWGGLYLRRISQPCIRSTAPMREASKRSQKRSHPGVPPSVSRLVLVSAPVTGLSTHVHQRPPRHYCRSERWSLEGLRAGWLPIHRRTGSAEP